MDHQAERAARMGKLPSKLDAEGYNPAGLQGAYGAPASTQGDSSVTTSAAPPELSPIEAVDKAIGLISRQRVAVS